MTSTLAELRAAAAARRTDRMAVHHSSATPEWYTPPTFLERVVARYGPFDLDPCADPRSPIWSMIPRHWTVADDGLAQPWDGRTYANPPYGRVIGDWTRKAAAEVASCRCPLAVMLVPSRTDTAWWWDATDAGAVPEFIRGRIRFVGPDGVPLASAPFPSALLVFRGPGGLPSGGAGR